MSKRPMLASIAVLSCALLSAGCATDLRLWVERDDGRQANADELAERAPEGVLDTGADLYVETEVVIDASDYDVTVFYDFERQGIVDDSMPWDLQLQRYVVSLNGGVSGDGQGAAQALDMPFDDVEQAPVDGYVVDSEDADGDGVVEYAIAEWYSYDTSTHVLTPLPLTWVVRSAEGRFFKLEFLEYYDSAGTAGILRLRWAELDAP